MVDLSFFCGKRVFLTGHTGFKGSWMSRVLIEAGADVTGYSLPPPSGPNLFSLAGLEGRMTGIMGDVRDFRRLKSAFDAARPHIVIHLAAQPLVRESYKAPRLTYETNVMGTVNVLECVRLCPGVRSVLNVTTDKVYRNNEWCWGYRENEPLDGFDPYSNSKSCSELVTHCYVSSFFSGGIPAVSTARAGNVIGGGDFAADRIIPDCVRAQMERRVIGVRHPFSTRPYQHVLEPVMAYLMMAQRQWERPELAGWYNVGPDEGDCVTTGTLVDLFCRAWGEGAGWENQAERLGAGYALTVNSGSSANLLAMTALTAQELGERRLKRGDEVITVAAGFPTTVNPIVQNGLVPVFVDMELRTCNIDVAGMEEAIGPKTKAVFVAHTLGSMYDMDAVMKLCERYGLWLIEDSCDALGAKWRDRYAGTMGHMGTFSFYPAHHITMGEGGAVVTSDAVLHRILMSMRDWGRDCWCRPGADDTCKKRFGLQRGRLPFGYDHKYTYSHVGYNLKITDWQAAIGLAQLKKLDAFLERRRRNAAVLLEELSDLEHVFMLPEPAEPCSPSWFGFLLCVRPEAPFTRRELVTYLETHGVGTRQLFAGNLLRQPMMTEGDVFFRMGSGPLMHSRDLSEAHYAMLPRTDFLMEHAFWLGTAQNVDESDERKVSSIIHAFVKEAGA